MKNTAKISFISVLFVAVSLVPGFTQAPDQAQPAQQRPSNPDQVTTDSNPGAQARTSAQERAQNIREQAQERGAQVRQDVCERHEERLQQNIPNLTRSATTLLGVMDDMHERVEGFYEDGPLTVENFDELNENVEAARTDAADAVETAEDFEFELDCDEPGLGQQMDGFRQAVAEAREDLKVYREELVSLISALRAEAAEANENGGDTDGTDSDSEDEVDDEAQI